MTDITFTRITENFQQNITQVSKIIYDNIPVAWIKYDDLKRIIVCYKKELYYIDGENLTIRKVVKAIGFTRFIVSWAERGERYKVQDELVIHAPQNTIRIFSNPKDYLDYSEYGL